MKNLSKKIADNIAKNKKAKENGTLDMSKHPQVIEENLIERNACRSNQKGN